MNVTLASMEKAEINALNATVVAENVKDLRKISVFLALMSASHLFKKVEKLVHAVDLITAQLVFTVTMEVANPALPIAQHAFLKLSAKPAFLDFR